MKIRQIIKATLFVHLQKAMLWQPDCVKFTYHSIKETIEAHLYIIYKTKTDAEICISMLPLGHQSPHISFYICSITTIQGVVRNIGIVRVRLLFLCSRYVFHLWKKTDSRRVDWWTTLPPGDDTVNKLTIKVW